jgi:hypothetical protein
MTAKAPIAFHHFSFFWYDCYGFLPGWVCVGLVAVQSCLVGHVGA